MPDYGLDGMVEVFDGQGRATGHMFFVQLKATDEKDFKAALRVRLARQTFDYYNTLVLPVLLAVFHAPTSSLYARWLLEDLFQVRPRQSKTLTVQLCEDDKWIRARLPALIHELESVKRAKHIGERELRIERYYEHRRSINPADKPTGPERPAHHFRARDRVFHGAFGFGVVDDASEFYLFVQFEEDDMARKFLPGDTWEFVKIDRS